MTEWTRSTPWRQGSILDQKVLWEVAPGSPASFQKFDIAVVVSHDCDIAADPPIEPGVEAIPGTFPPEKDGSLTHAKAARKLHLALTEPSENRQRFAEFTAGDKFQIPKAKLVNHAPSSKYVISAKDIEILRRWLAARYRRQAFPDAFEKRFDRVEDRLKDILKKSSSHLRAVLFDLDDEKLAQSACSEEPYSLGIYLVHTSDPNPSESLKAAEATKAKIEKAFQDRYMQAGQWTGIELAYCDVISDNALTYLQYLQLAEWRLEGLSLRSDPVGPMTEENS
jgi:hypothetical protein